MANKKTARRALFSSVLALILCCCMLVGTTFAWFTDSVTSAGNKIQSGTLKIDLELLKDGVWTSIKDSKEPIFNYDLWEPGYTQVEVLKIENEGTLALKWLAKFQSANELSILADVIDVYVCPSATEIGYPADRNLDGYTRVGTVAEFVNTIESTTNGSLMPEGKAGSIAYLGIALKMQETAGNDYQGKDLGGAFDIMILATQETYEKDSFDDQYDLQADLPGTSVVPAPDANTAAVYGDVHDMNGEKIATYNIPAGAVDPNAENLKVNVKEATDANFTALPAGLESKGFKVEVIGLVDGNTTPVTVQLKLGAGYDPATVALYHYNDPIACTYNPTTGYVTFESTNFSPFTVVYDAESVYNPPVVGPETEYPVATVTPYEINEPIEWGNYGQWSPTEGLEANLEAAYKFACPAELDPVFANWYCDFYVSLNKDLDENEIFLGGNYGDFGWVGFHNGDMTLAANTEIPLLGSFTNNPWTYSDVYNFVGEFICGVGDVNDALADATFTVKLRLTNPDNAEQYYDVATVTHTFTKVVNSGDELQDAVNNGNQNIELGGDIDLGNGGLIIP